eukprot:5973041-Amphidinium_carterae.1
MKRPPQVTLGEAFIPTKNSMLQFLSPVSAVTSSLTQRTQRTHLVTARPRCALTRQLWFSRT